MNQVGSKFYFSHASRENPYCAILYENNLSHFVTVVSGWRKKDSNQQIFWVMYCEGFTVITEYQTIYTDYKLTSYISRMQIWNSMVLVTWLLYSFFVLCSLLGFFSFLVSFAQAQDEQENCHKILECNPCLWCKCALCQTASPIHLHLS